MKNSYIDTFIHTHSVFERVYGPTPNERWLRHRITSIIFQYRSGIWWSGNLILPYSDLPPTLCFGNGTRNPIPYGAHVRVYYICNRALLHIKVFLPDAPSLILVWTVSLVLLLLRHLRRRCCCFSLLLHLFQCTELLLMPFAVFFCLKPKVRSFENVHAHKFIRIICLWKYLFSQMNAKNRRRKNVDWKYTGFYL